MVEVLDDFQSEIGAQRTSDANTEKKQLLPPWFRSTVGGKKGSQKAVEKKNKQLGEQGRAALAAARAQAVAAGTQHAMTRGEMRTRCQELGLSTKGNPEQLAKRIAEHERSLVGCVAHGAEGRDATEGALDPPAMHVASSLTDDESRLERGAAHGRRCQ